MIVDVMLYFTLVRRNASFCVRWLIKASAKDIKCHGRETVQQKQTRFMRPYLRIVWVN